eukprot:22464-Pelagococcus_subviridis.AAC.1
MLHRAERPHRRFPSVRLDRDAGLGVALAAAARERAGDDRVRLREVEPVEVADVRDVAHRGRDRARA